MCSSLLASPSSAILLAPTYATSSLVPPVALLLAEFDCGKRQQPQHASGAMEPQSVIGN